MIKKLNAILKHVYNKRDFRLLHTRYEFWSHSNISLGQFWLNWVRSNLIQRNTIDETGDKEVYIKRQVVAADLVS